MDKHPNMKIARADGQNEEEGRAAGKNENEPAVAAAATAQERKDQRHPNIKIGRADGQNEQERRAAGKNGNEPPVAADATARERKDQRHPRDILGDLEAAALYDQHRHHATVAALELAGNGATEADIAAVVNYIQVHAPDSRHEEDAGDVQSNPNKIVAAAHYCHNKILEFAKENLNAGFDTLQDCRTIQLHVSALRNLGVRLSERQGLQNIEDDLENRREEVQDKPNLIIAAAHYANEKVLDFATQNLNAGVDLLRDCRNIQMHIVALRNLGVRMCERMGQQTIEDDLLERQSNEENDPKSEENDPNSEENSDN